MDFLRKLYSGVSSLVTGLTRGFISAIWISTRYPRFGPHLLARRRRQDPASVLEPGFLVFLSGFVFTAVVFRAHITGEIIRKAMSEGKVDPTLLMMAYSALLYSGIIVLMLYGIRIVMRVVRAMGEGLGIIVGAPERRFLQLPREDPTAYRRRKALPFAMIGAIALSLVAMTLVWAIPGSEAWALGLAEDIVKAVPKHQIAEIEYERITGYPFQQPVYLGTLVVGLLVAALLAPFFWPVSRLLFTPLTLASRPGLGQALFGIVGAWGIAAIAILASVLTLSAYFSSSDPTAVERIAISNLVCEVTADGVEAGFMLTNQTTKTALVPPAAFNVSLYWEVPADPEAVPSFATVVPLVRETAVKTREIGGGPRDGFTRIDAKAAMAVTIESRKPVIPKGASFREGGSLGCAVSSGTIFVNGRYMGVTQKADITRYRTW